MKHIKKELFDMVKSLTEKGGTISECQKFTGLAHATISRIRAAESYEAYCEPKEQKKPILNPTTVKIEATHYMMTELQKTNELLTAISAKLAYIVDELTK